MKIQDLLLPDPGLRAYGAQPEMDPLTEEHALQEAQLLDLRFDSLTLTVGVLFDLRMALQLREANTGVLVARGVRELSWSSPSRDTPLTAWTIDGSVPRHQDRLFGLQLGMWPAPGAEFRLLAESAFFFAGDVPGLGEAPPNYTGANRVNLSAELAGWDSQFEPVHAVFLDPAPSDWGAALQ